MPSRALGTASATTGHSISGGGSCTRAPAPPRPPRPAASAPPQSSRPRLRRAPLMRLGGPAGLLAIRWAEAARSGKGGARLGKRRAPKKVRSHSRVAYRRSPPRWWAEANTTLASQPGAATVACRIASLLQNSGQRRQADQGAESDGEAPEGHRHRPAQPAHGAHQVAAHGVDHRARGQEQQRLEAACASRWNRAAAVAPTASAPIMYPSWDTVDQASTRLMSSAAARQRPQQHGDRGDHPARPAPRWRW